MSNKRKMAIIGATAVLMVIFELLVLYITGSAKEENSGWNTPDGRVEIIDSADCTYDYITHRDGKIVIERVVGVCLNEQKDGVITNPSENMGTYISYRSVEGVEAGDTVVTYYIYNPESNAEDDVLERFDYVIGKVSKGGIQKL